MNIIFIMIQIDTEKKGILFMNYKKLKDMNISDIILGTDYYGMKYPRETCFEIMKLYISDGGNMIDTARMYCGGKSEETIGDFLRINNLTDKVYIATKAAHPPLENMSQNRLSPEEIEADTDKSLKALKRDYIDLLWLHRDDVRVPVCSIIDTLDALVKKGKIRHYGASNWTGKRIADANEYAKKINAEGFSASQIQWSLAKHNGSDDKTIVIMNDNEYEFYKKSKIPVFAFCSQAKGFFEKYALGQLSEKARDRFLNADNIKTFEKLKQKSIDTGKSISSLSLMYLTENKDFDTFAIIGPSNPEQLKQSLDIR